MSIRSITFDFLGRILGEDGAPTESKVFELEQRCIWMEFARSVLESYVVAALQLSPVRIYTDAKAAESLNHDAWLWNVSPNPNQSRAEFISALVHESLRHDKGALVVPVKRGTRTHIYLADSFTVDKRPGREHRYTDITIEGSTEVARRSGYTAGEKLSFIVTLVNTGTVALTDLTLTDDLAAYTLDTQTLTPLSYVPDSLLYYQNGVAQSAPTVTAGPPLIVSGLTVPAEGSVTIVYQAQVNALAPLAVGSELTNTATVTGGTLSAPLTASATVTAGVESALSIAKAMSPETVTGASELTYTFILQNAGNAEVAADAALVLTDTFDPLLHQLAVSYNGTPWSANVNYSYDAATGLFTTLAGQLTVPAAQYTQDPTTGVWTTTPGVSVLTISGTV